MERTVRWVDRHPATTTYAAVVMVAALIVRLKFG